MTLFRKIASIGEDIFENQQSENAKIDNSVKFPICSDSVISKIKFDKNSNRLYVNSDQYFTNIDENIFNYKIGNHQAIKKLFNLYEGEEITFELIQRVQKLVYQLKNDLKLRVKLSSLVNKAGGINKLVELSQPILERHDDLIREIEKKEKKLEKKKVRKKIGAS